MKKALFIIFLWLALLVPKAIAQETFYGEHIRNFQSQMNINGDGTVNVTEYIDYDFGSLERHGIFRNIPFIRKNTEGKKFELIYKDFLVADEHGKKYKFQKSKIDDEIQLKIGDPDRLITGHHVYLINYTVYGAITYFSDHDELFWNVTGNGWDVPIQKASAVVTLPKAVRPEESGTACYTGALGSKEQQCSSAIVANNVKMAFETTAPLQINEGLTIVSGFPRGVVAVLEAKPYITFWETPFGKVLGALLLGAFTFVIVFWYIIYPIWIVIKWVKHGRDPKVPEGPVSAWFDPPKGKDGRSLTPTEVGALVDETVNQRDISAMIVDLARRGYLKIEERKKNDFYFIKRKEYLNDTNLQEIERDMLSAILGADEENRVKDLKIAEEITLLKNKVYTNLVKDGYFPKNPQTTRAYYYAMAIIGITTFNIPLFVVALTFGRAMPVKTAAGVTAANVSRSLRNFLSSQERQLKFQASKQLMFEKLLPFAVAFGVEQIWAERFKDLNLRPPEWYSSYNSGHFSTMNFTHSLNSSFASFSRAATPVSSSTGHSSGFSGGSSGGGGGGGGGGSW